jgi:hypothetical protein
MDDVTGLSPDLLIFCVDDCQDFIGVIAIKLLNQNSIPKKETVSSTRIGSSPCIFGVRLHVRDFC